MAAHSYKHRCLFLCQLSITLLHIMTGVASAPVAIEKYSFYNDAKNWTDASSFCASKHSHLAAVYGKNDLESLLQAVGPVTGWVGGSRDDSDTWQWIEDNRELTVSGINFLTKAADASHYQCAYLKVDTVNPTIFPVNVEDRLPCTDKLQYICKASGNSTELWVSEEQADWGEAVTQCQEKNRVLASFPDEFVNLSPSKRYGTLMSDLGKTLPVGNYWIGLHHTGWTWTSGGFITYTNGSDIRSSGSTNNKCLLIDSTGRWLAEHCSKTLPFTCMDIKTNTGHIFKPAINHIITGILAYVLIMNLSSKQ